MKDLQSEIGPALQDPAKQPAIIAQIAKGDANGTLSAGNAAKKAAIQRLQREAGTDVLSGPQAEYQKKAAFDAFTKDQAQQQKELAQLTRGTDAQDMRDIRLKKRMVDELPVSDKQKMINALKYLGKKAVQGTAIGVAAKFGYHLLGE